MRLASSKRSNPERVRRLPEPPTWTSYAAALLGLAITAAVLTRWPPPQYFEIAIPLWFGSALVVHQLMRLLLGRRYDWESLRQTLLWRDSWREPKEPAAWWDRSDGDIARMSLDDLRHAYERALGELAPRDSTPTAFLARQRYERLRDAYYERRGDAGTDPTGLSYDASHRLAR